MSGLVLVTNQSASPTIFWAFLTPSTFGSSWCSAGGSLEIGTFLLGHFFSSSPTFLLSNSLT